MHACSVVSLTLCDPWTVARPPARLLCPWDVPRQESWSGLPFPTPGALPNPGIELVSPTLAAGFLTTEPPWKVLSLLICKMGGKPSPCLCFWDSQGCLIHRLCSADWRLRPRSMGAVSDPHLCVCLPSVLAPPLLALCFLSLLLFLSVRPPPRNFLLQVSVGVCHLHAR